VYFETLGDRLGPRDLSSWYYRFGLGRRTGIGIRERRGLIPVNPFTPMPKLSDAWQAAIGQGLIEATPLQMANVAATIARGGVWVRPKLLRDGQGVTVDIDPALGPDRVDLHLSSEALAAVRDGMVRVVNSEGGTGRTLHREDMVVAGKTGTATAGRLRVRKRDPQGEVVRDAQGNEVFEFPIPSTRDEPNPNPDARWYRVGIDGKTFNHAWFIGFAPADNPKLAFAVLIEYGMSGGTAAGSVAKEMLDACVEHGYLPRTPKALPAGAVSSSSTSR
jgi:penicillin-binding protein 2